VRPDGPAQRPGQSAHYWVLENDMGVVGEVGCSASSGTSGLAYVTHLVLFYFTIFSRFRALGVGLKHGHMIQENY
jgi:hypothetical protein